MNDQKKLERVKEELAKYGIHNNKELMQELKKMQPLNIAAMTLRARQ